MLSHFKFPLHFFLQSVLKSTIFEMRCIARRCVGVFITILLLVLLFQRYFEFLSCEIYVPKNSVQF